MRTAWGCCGLLGLMLINGGCGSKPPTATGTTTSSTTGSAATSSSATSPDADSSARPTRRAIEIGGSSAATSSSDSGPKVTSVTAALKPLQIMLGKWNGTSRKAQLDAPDWAYDWQTDPQLPALLMKSAKGHYLKEARITFLIPEQKYRLTTIDDQETTRVYLGEFTQPVADVPGDNNKPQRTYKLQFMESVAADKADGEQWQISFHQQDNNRYIVELDRKRGTGSFQRVDTINTMREGTSFAMNSDDYGERTCIISQGLGTMQVAYKGKSYWVCCTGCKAAFEAEPERWLAKWEEKKKSMSPN